MGSVTKPYLKVNFAVVVVVNSKSHFETNLYVTNINLLNNLC